MRRPLVLALLLAPVLLLAACGGTTDSTSGTPTSGASAPADETSACETVTTPEPANIPAVTGEAGAQPTIAKPTGNPPAELVVKDVVQGDGAVACAGGTLTVNYEGVDWETGTVFDSSWERGDPDTFALDGLIEGWQVGLPGMRVGGRRELVIPPEQAYGPAGAGHELSGKTLVFVVDLVAVG